MPTHPWSAIRFKNPQKNIEQIRRYWENQPSGHDKAKNDVMFLLGQLDRPLVRAAMKLDRFLSGRHS